MVKIINKNHNTSSSICIKRIDAVRDAPARSPRIQRTREERKHIGYKEYEKNRTCMEHKKQPYSASHAGNKLKTTQTNYQQENHNYKTTKQWRSKGRARHLYRCGNFARKYISTIPIGAPIWPQTRVTFPFG